MERDKVNLVFSCPGYETESDSKAFQEDIEQSQSVGIMKWRLDSMYYLKGTLEEQK